MFTYVNVWAATHYGCAGIKHVNTKPVTVESYSDVAWKGSWRQRASGLWAAGAVGMATGAAIGLVAPFFPVVVGALTLAQAGALVLTSVATFASLGTVTGAVAGGLVGSSSGSAAAVAEETERRIREREARMGLEDAELGMSEAAKKEQEKPQGFLAKIKSYINVRSGLIFIALGMVAGAVFAAAAIPAGLPAMATALTGTGLGAVVTAATTGLSGAAATANAALATAAYTVGVMGCFGAMFGVRYAAVTNDVRQITASMLSKTFSDEKTAKPAVSLPEKVADIAAADVASPHCEAEKAQENRTEAPVARILADGANKNNGDFRSLVTQQRQNSESQVALSS